MELSIFIIVVFVFGYVIYVYNKALGLDQVCKNKFSYFKSSLERRELFAAEIAVQLGAGEEYEKMLIEKITRIREGNFDKTGDPDAFATIRKELARSESYPTADAIGLKDTFQKQLENFELKVLTSIGDYNLSVADYNTFIKSFPEQHNRYIYW